MKDSTVESMLASLKGKYELKELDVGEFRTVKCGPIKFRISQYEVKGIGNLSVMKGSAMMGLMKMDTVILCSFEKDAPIFSYDRIHAMGNDTLIYELYDSYIEKADLSLLGAIKDKCSSIPGYVVKPAWYDSIKLPESVAKKAKGKEAKPINDLAIEYFNEYLKVLDAVRPCDPSLKKPLVDKYTQGLLDNGGSSTDAFLKYIGKEKTSELFNKVLFASK